MDSDFNVLEGRIIMSGTLYLCATPIGNLEDITLRVLRILKEVDLIAAEDTRNSIKLLNYYEIKTPMTSYHEYNKFDKAKYLVRELLNGKNIALITDAGTPGISDPGEELVKMSYEAGIEVTALPGACALITALTLSGLSTKKFEFESFLPNAKKEREISLEALKMTNKTIILYEAPHRLVKTLKGLYEVLGDRRISLCKELTKLHENVFNTSLKAAIGHYEINSPKGEYVIVIEGKNIEELILEKQEKWQSLSVKEHVEYYIDRGMEKKEAMKAAASDRGMTKREVYNTLLNN